MIISCPNCRASFNLPAEKTPPAGAKMRCFRCKEIFQLETTVPSSPKGGSGGVLIANESKAFCQTVSDLLLENGINAEVAHDGEEALRKIAAGRPHIALLDVALPKVFGFEVCERVKNDEAMKFTRIILIAAIYDKTKYKRTPGNLYGADDYIEKHHIHDRLVEKIWTLAPDLKAGVLSSAGLQPAPPVIPPQTEKEVLRASDEEAGGDALEMQEKAGRLARIIVSDIALYNEGLIVEGIRNNNFYELLKDDIEEGRKLFRSRVPQTVWEKRDYLKECLDDLIRQHSKML